MFRIGWNNNGNQKMSKIYLVSSQTSAKRTTYKCCLFKNQSRAWVTSLVNLQRTNATCCCPLSLDLSNRWYSISCSLQNHLNYFLLIYGTTTTIEQSKSSTMCDLTHNIIWKLNILIAEALIPTRAKKKIKQPSY